MKIAVMQPYFFPYIGYWQLINIVDIFVIYDDVSFIKGGYINRNSLLNKSNAQLITLELFGASSNKKINDINLGDNRNKLLKTIKQNYSKAPFYNNILPLIEEIINNNEKKLHKFLAFSLIEVSKYLNIKTNFIYSSEIKNNKSLNAQDRLIEISKILNATEFINPIGGIELYDREVFSKNMINLSFLKTSKISYNQFNDNFVSNLSIIDVLMFNDKEQIKSILEMNKLI
ncbi:MAG: hypothetical protein CMD09_04870 [Flavobacteriales bacterium]|nr:hypothetical protein [Flavobacteriales bacterium]|tara:strand:+ start:4172 stop:4861 length:690 start_codon:yes stop_codon:yes gene_type:complete